MRIKLVFMFLTLPDSGREAFASGPYSSANKEDKIMKKFYGFYPILFTMMILIIITSGGASFAGDGKGVYGGDRKPGIKANDPLVEASATLGDREAVPEGLTKTEWGKIRATIELDQYRLHTGKHKNMYGPQTMPRV